MAKKQRPKVFESTIITANHVKAILDANYEAGRQDKCKEQVFRTKIHPETGLSRRQFFRLLKMPDTPPEIEDDPNQLKLPF
jgi:hypothetical protein